MLARSLYIVFILFEAFFLNVAVPGHTRGEITVPGYRSSAAMGMDMDMGCCVSEHHPDRSRPTPADRAHCAMCFFAVGLCVPPPPILAPTPWGQAFVNRAFQIQSRPFDTYPLPYYGRAPPLRPNSSDA